MHPIAGKFASINDIEKAIIEVHLQGYEDVPARKLSAGQVRRVGLARLLLAGVLAKDACWILDEPFTSLDVEGCHWLELQISRYISQGGCVLLTSHQAMNLEISPRLIQLELLEESFCY